MSPRSTGMIAVCMGTVLLGACEQRPCDPDPQIVIEPLRFESVSADHVVAIGSWEPRSSDNNPFAWAPWALVRIECHRGRSECTESWAQLVADEHGENPLGLISELTRYDIAEWTGPNIRATGMLREKTPVQLSINVTTKTVRHETLDKRNDLDGADYWVLK